jgi:hypothetical protein
VLVSFQTKNYPTITFFGDVAVSFLQLMGMSGVVPGAILARDVPDVLARLKSQLTIEERESTASEEHRTDREPRVRLATRAFPLIELLSSAADNGNDVIWDEA